MRQRKSLREAKQKTAVGKDDQIHADQKARDAAQKDAEKRRKQFLDQQKRIARDQAKRADDTKRRDRSEACAMPKTNCVESSNNCSRLRTTRRDNLMTTV